ncbi:MAG: SynChlorMet cassette radical SAM/SPASM protein ScmF [bacterium]
MRRNNVVAEENVIWSEAESFSWAMRKYPLNSIYFYLTEGCNLACRHCWIAPKYQGDNKSGPVLSFALFRSIINQAKPLGLSGVKLTGGEPFLHPQINEILDYIKEQDLRLIIETNGVLATPEICQKVKTCKRAHVSVSIDGVDAETHEWVRGVKGCLVAAKQGVRNLVAAGINPQIIMTIMRRNKDQIEPMVRLAESLGASSVKFNLVQPTARGAQMHEANETLNIEELVSLGRWVDRELAASTKLRLMYAHPAAFRSLRRLLSTNSDGCGVCGIFGIIGVLANGSYALCGIGESVPEFVFGDVQKDRLADVWQNNAVLKDIRQGLPEKLEGICADCIMKQRCLGSCLAQNYYSDKNLWAPNWFCVQARERNIFPEFRRKSSFDKAGN